MTAQQTLLTTDTTNTTDTKKSKERTDDFDWNLAEGTNTILEEQYLRLQWLHGQKNSLNPKGLFISKEQTTRMESPSFKAGNFVTEKGQEVAGFYAEKAFIAVIRMAEKWSTLENGVKKSKVSILCRIKGQPDLVEISVSGVTRALPWKNLVYNFKKQVVNFFNGQRPKGMKQFEQFALWMPYKVGDFQTFTKDNNSKPVTYPELDLPETVSAEWAKSLWVGKDLYEQMCRDFQDTESWQKDRSRSEDDDRTRERKEKISAINDTLKAFAGIGKKHDWNEEALSAQVSEGRVKCLKDLTDEELESAHYHTLHAWEMEQEDIA